MIPGNDFRRSFEILFSYIVNSISVFGFEKLCSSLNAENVNFFLNWIFFLQSTVLYAPVEANFSFVLLLQQMHCVIAFENVFAQKDEQKWRTEIINALHICTCWVSYGPDEQNTCHHALHLLAFEQRYIRLCSQHVDFDLLQILLLKIRKSGTFKKVLNGLRFEVDKIVLSNLEIFLSFAFQSLTSKISIDWHVIQQYFPTVAPLTRYGWRNAIPTGCSELFNIYVLLAVNDIMYFYALFLHLAFLNLSQYLLTITFFVFLLLHF